MFLEPQLKAYQQFDTLVLKHPLDFHQVRQVTPKKKVEEKINRQVRFR